MEGIKTFFTIIGAILLISLGPSLLFLAFQIVCFIFPIVYLVKKIYKVFICGNVFIKIITAIAILFAIDYAMNHFNDVLAIWLLLAGACFVFGLIGGSYSTIDSKEKNESSFDFSSDVSFGLPNKNIKRKALSNNIINITPPSNNTATASQIKESQQLISHKTDMAEPLQHDISRREKHKCPSCNAGHLCLMKSKNKNYWACTNYPKCTVTYEDNYGTPIINNTSTEYMFQKTIYPKINVTKPCQLYELALKIGGLKQIDIECMEYMDEDDPTIPLYKISICLAYYELTGIKTEIPHYLLPPYQKFVKVSFGSSNDDNLYSYFLGNNQDIDLDDNVIVYARDIKSGKPKRKIATIRYISSPYIPPPDKAHSPISLKVKGKFMASKSGKKFHNPCCSQMDDVTDNNAIWFQTEEEALWHGYSPCAKCILI